MLPDALLRTSVKGERIAPRFLTETDQPWLRALLDEVQRFCGRPFAELSARLAEPLSAEAPFDKQRLAAHVLQRSVRARPTPAVAPRKARAVLFPLASTSSLQRAQIVEEAAQRLGVTPAEVEESLFADVPAARVVGPVPDDLSPSTLALEVNTALAKAFLCRAVDVRVSLSGNARNIVRRARYARLLCSVDKRDEGALLDISGPLALFQRTTKYGRALASLLPALLWCDRFFLEASCVVRGVTSTLRLATGAPLLPAEEPARFDSRVEERFARDFARLAPGWDVVREPEPIQAGDALVFPDFALQERAPPRRRVLVEIVGFWTPEYLDKKLARYRAAGLPELLLLIDDELACGAGQVPERATVMRYRKRVDAGAVLGWLEARSARPLAGEVT